MLAGDGRYRALRDILARTPPRIRGREPGARIQTIDIAEQRALALALDSSYLFIQGPPGTGKTGRARGSSPSSYGAGRRVGVTRRATRRSTICSTRWRPPRRRRTALSRTEEVVGRQRRNDLRQRLHQ
jgi:hypothetical protein